MPREILNRSQKEQTMPDMCKLLSDAEVTIIRGALEDVEQFELYIHPQCGMRGQFSAFSRLPAETRAAINGALSEHSFYNIADPNPNACFYVYREKNGIHYGSDFVLLRDAQRRWWGVTKNTQSLGQYILIQANIRQRRSWSILREIRRYGYRYFAVFIGTLFGGIVAFFAGEGHSYLVAVPFMLLGGWVLLDICILSYFRHTAAFRKLSIAMIDADEYKTSKTVESPTPKKNVAGDRDGPVTVV
jgi:hypothetical protein